MSHVRFPKARVFRDPVHDIISYREETFLGPPICALIDAPEVQRLRHIRQLGLASLVFHGAEHSRFSHSLGVAHLARRMCDRMRSDLSDEERLVIVAAALLHDVGHAPFSHVMERVFSFHHEHYSDAIVRDPSSQVHRVLAAVDATLPGAVADLMSGRSEHFSHEIVSSQLDADRADYLLRDAHMTGVEVGRYDLERILLLLDHDATGLVVGQGAYESVEGYLIARYHMYRLVYFHRAVRAAEAMLQQTFARARRLLEDGDGSVLPDNALASLMKREAVTTSAYARLGDYHAWSLLARWAEHDDPVLSRLAGDLMARRLFKSSERDLGENGERREAEDAVVAAIREELAPNEQYLFVVDEASDTPYRPYMPGSDRDTIRVRDRAGRLFNMEERSPIVRALARSAYRLRRWYFHRDLAPKIRRIAGS